MLKVHDYIEHSARITFDCPHCEKEQTEVLSSGTNLVYCDDCKTTFVVELDEVVKHTLKFYTLQREKEKTFSVYTDKKVLSAATEKTQG